MVWLQLALVVGLLGILAAAMRYGRRVFPDSHPHLGIDLGTVSEGWLADQHRSRTDRLSS
jgi:hypothetical protein